MSFWGKLFGEGKAKEVEVLPSGPTLYDEQIPDTFNLGWFYSQGKNQYQMAKISNQDRDSHFYVIGGTGVGKSKFLQYLIMQDILEGRGVGVIDPHGDLVEDLKGLLTVGLPGADSEKIISDSIIVIDPTDPTYTVSFNPLEKLPGISAAEQANELVSTFKKIWADSWGVRMEDLMRNSLIALCEAELTLVELSTFLTKRGFREVALEKTTNTTAKEYFERFNTLTDRAAIPWIEPIMNKINTVFSDVRVREIFSSSTSSFNLRAAMDGGKVVLIKLDKGRLKDAANLLGALLVSKIQMAAFSRSDVPEKKRRPFYLYIDEFQNFASESFSIILSESRKYALYVTMAHQSLAQISNELRGLILSCAGIQVYFRLSREDASLLAKGAFQYGGNWEQNISDLQNLPVRTCYVKNKLQGGIIHIASVPIEAPWSLVDVSEDVFHEYVAELPFGRKYLVERKALASIETERRNLISQQVKEPEVSKKVAAPVEVKRLPPPAEEPIQKPKREVTKEKSAPVRAEIIPEEKGNSRHLYLQNLIKRLAEEKGYKATIEEPIPDGRVDIGLQKNGKKIACEISVTNTPEHECANIEKCLTAGYATVIMCSQDKKHLQKIKNFVAEKLAKSDLGKVMFLEPEELLLYLEEAAARDSTKEERIKGYKVKTNYQAVSQTDRDRKREALAQVILGAFKRLKGKDE
jgi:hypothetical protein